ncbi:ImmA/IrrE family metallo-endopeptidase [Azospirillum sp. TSH100]|uniref:ImmA/IrrE family metallo-endopeptidase n=1 Tax=Azospirillum sp. TSH100 TaxID=652764 RepID=UPI0010AB3287|nr:ImmA/IrrE family metallo-endopeptidase [Azospirillum sp. TSH100]QCG86770.1 ImmA/IrrE family metallo-endopeptidase [Azospirillum sp. TSH100]
MTTKIASPSAQSNSPLSRLKREFAAVGLKATDVLKSLPDWWKDALAHPSGIYEVRGFVAKHYGLAIGPGGELQTRSLPSACFKTRTGADVSVVAPARALATAVAHIVANAAVPPWAGVLPSAAELREAFIARSGKPWVGIDELLSACWERGVPVVYVPKLPVSQPKMDGMVTMCGDRPVIVVTKKVSHPAWMLFILAHEMGHLALGHLDTSAGGTIVDESISEDDAFADGQEHEANRYALRLLTGNGHQALKLNHLMAADALANAARMYGRQHGIDPGHVILNAVRNTKRDGKSLWPLGNAALGRLTSGGSDPAVSCRGALRCHVDLDSLSDDSLDFLERLGVL